MGLLWSRSWRVLITCFTNEPCKNDSVNSSCIHVKLQEESQIGKLEFPCSQLFCGGDGSENLVLWHPILFVMSIAGLGQVKTTVTLSPLCCKTSLNLVVLKLAPQAYLESCRKTGDVSRYLSCSPDFFSVFTIWNANKVFHTSGEFMAAECSGVIDNE